MNPLDLWARYKQYLCVVDSIGLRLDVSRMPFDDALFDQLSRPFERAFAAMDELERGAIANADEQRRVGHYWLRAPQLAGDEAVRDEIAQAVDHVKRFARDVQGGVVAPERGDGFYVVLVIGIGGSALGSQLLCDALGGAEDPMMVRFLDNTDPDGIDRVLTELSETVENTLTIVVSKSGSTRETRNAMLETAQWYRKAGLSFAQHAVAITGEGSALHKQATEERWLATFTMWDFVGGRTSLTSAGGLLPAALIGVDVDALLDGARVCDAATRVHDIRKNPAALMAAMWHHAGTGRGERNLVVLPYADRLGLLGKYLQQLIMESLGKRVDRSGKVVHQGLTVFGNKGSTDQHSFMQQLRDGRNDFFVTFVEALRDRDGKSMEVDDGATSGDYLNAFLHGTRSALFDEGRASMTITVDRIDARSLGALVALFERAVGLYAELIDVNAYDQPGVEAGKKAAGAIIELQSKALAHVRASEGKEQTAEQIAQAIGESERVEAVFHILEHAAANEDHAIERLPGPAPPEARYRANEP